MSSELLKKVRHLIGSAVPVERAEEVGIRGRDAATGIPQAILLTSEDRCVMLAEPVDILLGDMERIR